jgi:dihydrofolate reductase
MHNDAPVRTGIEGQEVEVGKLTVFNFVTLNGFFQGPDNDISWAHESPDNDYAAEMLQGGYTILFGRVTYELMAQYWPTPQAFKDVPAVATGMRDAEKIVFSKTLKNVEWKNTTIIRDHVENAVKKMKASGKSMAATSAAQADRREDRVLQTK